MHRSFKFALLLPIIALFASTNAQADSIGTVATHFDGPSPYAFIDLTYQGGYGAGYIGFYNWTVTSDSTHKLPQQFTSFCYDVAQDIYPGADYTFNVHPLVDGPDPSVPNYSHTTAQQISTLWNEHSGDLYAGNNNPNAEGAAAFQVALWQILYGNDIHFGNYSYVTTGLNWATQAVSNPGALNPNLWLLTNPNAQDQLVFVPGPPRVVPLPNSALGGALLLALYVARRVYRRRTAAAQQLL